MGDKAITAVVTVLTAIIGVAIVAVLVSGQAQTSNVITAGGKSFAQILGAAVSPVTGGNNAFGGFGGSIGGLGGGLSQTSLSPYFASFNQG